MKHVNLDPQLEKKKADIMKQFRDHKTDDGGPATAPASRASVTVSVPGAGNIGAALPSQQPSPTPSPQTAPQSPPPTAAEAVDAETLKERVIDALKNIYDPEIPVNIYDLGLIYRVDIKDGFADIDMTLTAPGCPVAQTFPGMVEGAVRLVPGIAGAAVELVWEPPWTQARISEAARLELGLI